MAPQSIVYFRGITPVKLCLWLFIQTFFPLLRRCQAAFTVITEHSQSRFCSTFGPQTRLLCLGCTRPAWLPGPFMETVLGLIIPSCASSPSPAGLRVPVSSAKTPQSHRSQGETEGKAQAWRVGASLHTFKV